MANQAGRFVSITLGLLPDPKTNVIVDVNMLPPIKNLKMVKFILKLKEGQPMLRRRWDSKTIHNHGVRVHRCKNVSLEVELNACAGHPDSRIEMGSTGSYEHQK